MKKFIIAGNFDEYVQWRKKQAWADAQNTVCVSSPAVLRGTANPHGVFIGSWQNRDDLEDIFTLLLTSTDIATYSYETINKLWEKVKK
jgi:hypothetical protein